MTITHSDRRSISTGGMVGAAVLLAALLVLPTSAHSDPDSWRLEGWATDFRKLVVPAEEIISGGPPRDGIPSIDEPKFVAAAGAGDLAPTEAVIGLEIAGDARAYPLRILTWHEIVNDVVGGVPVAVTYCPLCNAAIVFERQVGGRALAFGTTGKLRHSDLIMYDRQTESWWQQFTGEAIAGVLAGTALVARPARLESFAEFKARHATGRVLVPNDPTLRNYGRNPYAGYDTAARPFLYHGAMPDGIEPMARVVVVDAGGAKHAVALDKVRTDGPLRIGEIELSWRAGQASALDAATIAGGRDVGTVLARRMSADGTATDVRYDVTFAFVFHAFHPDRPIDGARPKARGQ
jgi:hypothetical protein